MWGVCHSIQDHFSLNTHLHSHTLTLPYKDKHNCGGHDVQNTHTSLSVAFLTSPCPHYHALIVWQSKTIFQQHYDCVILSVLSVPGHNLAILPRTGHLSTDLIPRLRAHELILHSLSKRKV